MELHCKIAPSGIVRLHCHLQHLPGAVVGEFGEQVVERCLAYVNLHPWSVGARSACILRMVVGRGVLSLPPRSQRIFLHAEPTLSLGVIPLEVRRRRGDV